MSTTTQSLGTYELIIQKCEIYLLGFSAISGYKVKGPNVVACLNRTPIFELWVARCGYKKQTPKHMCFNEIGLCARNLLVILSADFDNS